MDGTPGSDSEGRLTVPAVKKLACYKMLNGDVRTGSVLLI
jgi:hypothetical protein